ncbi:Fe-S cluster assembly protein SufD [Bifidobacterium dolichotidis]|uniref:Fe-S cluster assembly protein SufD n=1 Tax=Bifidobacterium dolichotidis TaxID=2306976 RepID=A0A430FSY4_9BIFI|nr:Fe-S cluster assembly protein SufD [Bifidobacterium dolichotidis]RSX55961.1 Fe-S cluster assembly protein SufD [Bifidobacterium dolichotidis]
MATVQEIEIPVADPNDPYKIPAAMPSSADRAPRSFDMSAFAVPTRKQEDFRFTPVDRMSEFFVPFDASGTTEIAVSDMSGKKLDAEDVEVVREAMGERYSGKVSKPNDRPSAVQWNACSEAVIVHVKRSMTKPVLVKITGTNMVMDALHIVLHVDDDVHANIVVQHSGSVNLAEGVEINTGARSVVSTTFIQEWDAGSKHVGNHRIRVGKEASLRHAVVTLGGDVVRIRMDQDFGGDHGDLNMLGIYFVDPGEHIEHRTMVVHNEPDCRSRVVYKGALSGKGAHSTWVGNALIEPTAPGTDSYELNRNLVLTPGAIADSEPNLEIENGNIVGAGHASSVGRFDDEELFYLQSRGISEQEARKLVVRGFFAELIEEIGVEEISGHLMDAIDRRLARSETSATARN